MSKQSKSKKIPAHLQIPKTPPKNPTVTICHEQQMTARDVVQLVTNNFDLDTIVDIIVGIDGACEDWGVTEKLCKHFAAMAEVGKLECDPNDPEDQFDFTPKRLNDHLKYSTEVVVLDKALKRMQDPKTRYKHDK